MVCPQLVDSIPVDVGHEGESTRPRYEVRGIADGGVNPRLIGVMDRFGMNVSHPVPADPRSTRGTHPCADISVDCVFAYFAKK
jgi:hypothetical protein